MGPNDRKGHLAEALRWSTETEVDAIAALTSALGMALPVLYGALTGNLAGGLAAAVGSLAIGAVGAGRGVGEQVRDLASTLGPAILAATAAAFVAGHGWATDTAVTLLAVVAAVPGGYSYPLAAAATRFVLILLIVTNVAHAHATPHPAALLIPMAAGAAGTLLLNLLLGAIARALRAPPPQPAATAAPTPTSAQRYARWKRTLKTLAGWQYALRLGFCLSVAGLLQWLWPDHHLYWVAVTVAILTQRPIEAFPVMTTQRALGAVIGVMATGVLLIHDVPQWELVLGIGVLSGARPLLRARNYLAYSAIMTPLIILIMDAGQSPGAAVLFDRLLATFIGAALVIATNLIAGKALRGT